MATTDAPANIESLRKITLSAWWGEINAGLRVNANLGSRHYRLPAELQNKSEHAPTTEAIVELLEKAGYKCVRSDEIGWEVFW
ncbi:hypothetical protein QKT49_gp221 [Acanthamoeba castellanii medusavirus]|uniref:Uncharacterized protein n=1 Tax=Acanthamoeba castellanii medusavirus J1 TaxID=3114988 RepID=A0A3T1CXH5_9VIRU|nr:hypothetical protein QKT49_gp221 [Acanthamoeba castellanii medusavirus]BBI30542.1 hypothetical protein [Acanthamoeba castellanii medusavirus J1]